MKRKEKGNYYLRFLEQLQKADSIQQLGKNKNVYNRFPDIILKTFFINTSKATLNELLSDPGRN